MKNILIFRLKLLSYSETFIRSQGESIEKFNVIFACLREEKNGIQLDKEKKIVFFKGYFNKVLEYLFLKKIYNSNVIRNINKIRPSLIHSHFGIDASHIIQIKDKVNVPFVCTFHGYDITIRKEDSSSSFLAHVLYFERIDELKEKIDCFIAVSNFIKTKLIESNFPKDKIITHYIGVDTDKFNVVEKDKNTKKYILFVGRLVEKKGIFDLLTAFKNIQTETLDVELIIIGDGPLKKEVTQETKDLDSIKVVGRKNPDEIKSYLNKATVFCGPSKTALNGDSEAFGIVFIEAQACGIPVISYAHGGIPEAVKHGETGYLAEEGNTTELGEYLKILLTDDTLRNDFSKAARNHVLTNFDLKKQTKKLEKIYQKLITNYD